MLTLKRLVIRLDQHTRKYRGKMHDGVRRRRAACRASKRSKPKCVVMAMKAWPLCVESAIRVLDAGTIERPEVDIEKVVALALQMRQDMPAGLPVPFGEYFTRLPVILLLPSVR